MREKTLRAPLYEALLRYAQEKNILLHMPGHKGGLGFVAPELAAVGAIDFTEVPGLDDLHLPAEAIKEAEELAAQAFGAQESYFLVNGATSGIHALLLSVGEGATVMIPRNAHRSFLGGLILSGARPVYLDCVWDDDLQVAVAVTPEEVREKLSQNPEATAAFIVSPTFYGTVNEVKGIVDALEGAGIPLLVDEAHGGHFAFHPAYPRPALENGAKASVQGLHKTLPVLTQAGILHLAAGFPWLERVRESYDLLTSTSPSYPLMASLDLGRAIMQEKGTLLLERARELRKDLKKFVNGLPGLRCRDQEFKTNKGVADYDPLKVLIEVVDLDTTGFALDYTLRRRYGIQVEMAGENFVLAMFSAFNPPDDWEAFKRALAEIAKACGRRRRKREVASYPPTPPMVVTPRQAFWSKKKTVMIKEAEGLIAGEMVAVYPPGIPCLLPGELITPEVREYLERVIAQGSKIHGLKDLKRQRIEVLE